MVFCGCGIICPSRDFARYFNRAPDRLRPETFARISFMRYRRRSSFGAPQGACTLYLLVNVRLGEASRWVDCAHPRSGLVRYARSAKLISMKLTIRRLIFSDDSARRANSVGPLINRPRYVHGCELPSFTLVAMAYAVRSVVFPDDGPHLIDVGSPRINRHREIKLGKGAVHQLISMDPPTADFGPHNPPGIHPLHGRKNRAREVDLSEGSTAEHKAVSMSRTIGEDAPDIARRT